MKNLIFLFTFLLTVTSLVSQKKSDLLPMNNEHERLISDFAMATNAIANSKSSTEAKTLRLQKRIVQFQKAIQIIKSETVVNAFVKSMESDTRVNRDKVSTYVAAMSEKYPARTDVPMSFVRSLGDIRTNRDLQVAVEFYQLVGDRLAASDLCKTGDCDTAKTVNTKSRGGSSLSWVFTGEKQYVRTRDFYGYMYRCAYIDLDMYNNNDKTKENVRLDASSTTKTNNTDSPFEFKWKTKDNVDVWDRGVYDNAVAG